MLSIFVVDKSKIIPVDDLVKLCSDFYREDEIIEGRQLLLNFCKLPKRKGSDRLRSTSEDIVKCVINPKHHLPTFYAIDLARLPPTDIKHCELRHFGNSNRAATFAS